MRMIIIIAVGGGCRPILSHHRGSPIYMREFFRKSTRKFIKLGILAVSSSDQSSSPGIEMK